MRAVGLDLYNQTITGQVAMTIRSKVGDYDHTPCIICSADGLSSLADFSRPQIISNSNGGQVMPTLTAGDSRMVQKAKDWGGGYVMHSFNFELWDKGTERVGCIAARRAHDWLVYGHR